MLPPFCLKNFNKSNYSTTKNKNKEKKQEISFWGQVSRRKKFRFWDTSRPVPTLQELARKDVSLPCKVAKARRWRFLRVRHSGCYTHYRRGLLLCERSRCVFGLVQLVPAKVPCFLHRLCQRFTSYFFAILLSIFAKMRLLHMRCHCTSLLCKDISKVLVLQ